jgi:hypothetical protein
MQPLDVFMVVNYNAGVVGPSNELGLRRAR